MNVLVKIDPENHVSFHNNVKYCVGTGRMGLALQKEYYEQLRFVQENIGFSYIRGHGLFCDDIGIYHEHKDEQGNIVADYNFTYLDQVMDMYQELHIKPFLELGFMPKKLASGEQTVFYWKGNVTPPKAYERWCDLVKATLQHLMQRYGEEEVLTWPVEVWNEPNLPGFWKGADREEYYKLYDLTAKAVKEVHPDFQVGGPAICGGQDEVWMNGFLTYCTEKKPPIDFISRHHYTIEVPEKVGHYDYTKLYDPDYAFSTLEDCRKIIDKYPGYKDLPFYITEFNTAYVPNCPLHDTNENASYLARTLSKIGDYCTGYSYWTFGDVFEEIGIPFTPFHGGFGLVANGVIPKPTFWTFDFFSKLKGKCVFRNDNMVVMQNSEDSYDAIIWNYSAKIEALSLELEIPVSDGEYSLLYRIVDENTCNPLKVWHDIGEPANLSKQQLHLLQEASVPQVRTERLTVNENHITINNSFEPNAVVSLHIEKCEIHSDLGYDYERR